MYTKYYGFTHKPFELTPDPDVIFLSETHQEAVSILQYGVINRKGFLQLTGKVGTGKSTLLQSLIHSLDSNVHLCYIASPNFTVQEFYYFLGAKFGLKKFDGNKAKFIINLAAFLEKCRERNEHVLLIIDESQIMSMELLEEIRLLSNQEMHDVYGVLSIFLVGQPELNNLFDHQKLLPLRNRIAIRFHIDPLSLDETKAYITFRLRKAGRTTVLFSEKACREIHRASKGIPRSINILCDNALLTGFAEQRGIIDENIIRDCASELNQVEKNLLETEESQEEKQDKGETAAVESLIIDAKKQPAFLGPGRVALGVMVIVLLFISISATTDYWGKLPGAAPASAWFEKVNVHVQKVISSLKKNYLTLGAKTDLSPAGIRRFSLKEVKPAGLKEENNNAEVSTVSKKKISADAEANSAGRGEKPENSPPVENSDISLYVNITPQVGWANIRSGPSMDYEVIRSVPAGFPLLIIDQQKEWSQVEDYRKRTGWVATKLLAESNWVILKISQAKLRRGPSMNEEIVKKVEYGEIMEVLEIQEDWLRVVDKNGNEGWLPKLIIWPENYEY